MRLGRVCGNVVATVKAAGLARFKLLLIRDVDARDPAQDDAAGGSVYAAVDLVGAGDGGAARIDHGAGSIPTDAAIVAIVDSAQLDSRTTFVKR
jgi:microcompartment protein CcmK/EutM